MQKALKALIRRHEILRTTIELDPSCGEPKQRVHHDVPVHLATVDARAFTTDEWDRHFRAEANRPFDLATSPLLRVLLFKGVASYSLQVTVHHIVVDAWYLGPLVANVALFYRSARDGRPHGLEPLPVQYADFAHWQRTWMAGDRLDRQMAHWADQLEGVEPLKLPTDRPRPPSLDDAAAEVAFTVPAEIRDRLAALCRIEGTTLYVGLLAAWEALLAQYSGQADFTVGTCFSASWSLWAAEAADVVVGDGWQLAGRPRST